jgi:hypothetical protein
LATEPEPRSVEYLPLGHPTQSLSALEPVAARYLPAGQSVQSDDPDDAAYVPK